MIVDNHTTTKNSSCKEIITCRNILDSSEVIATLKNIQHRYNIEDIVGTSAFTTYVQYHALKTFGDRLGVATWVLNARIKPECRRILNSNNISVVKYRHIKEIGDLQNISEEIAYPAVIKPAGGTGTDLVCKANNYEELVEGYTKIIETYHEPVIPESCNNLLVNGQTYNLVSEAIVEEYLSGIEYTFDGYVYNNCPIVLAVHQKCFGLEDKTFRDQFYITPPADWTQKRASLAKTLINDVVQALGMNNALFHIEARCNNDEWKIIEVNPRLGGGSINENVVLSTGNSLVDVYVSMLCGKVLNLKNNNKPKIVFDFGILLPSSGRIKRITGVDKIKKLSGVNGVYQYYSVGEYVSHLVGERFALLCNGSVEKHSDAFDIYNKAQKFFLVEMEQDQI